MRRGKRYTLSCLLLCLLFRQATAQGLEDWQHKTPGSNTMGNSGSGTFLQMRDGRKEITHMKQWYFYKNHVIGKTDSVFFAANEKENSIEFFREQNTYAKYISQNNLNPDLWTRWYSDNWSTTDFFAIALIFWFISIPFVLCLIWAFYAMLKVYFNFKRPFTITASIIAVLLLATLLLDKYPQSF